MIQMEHLGKSFGDICAVDDISMEIREGEVFGLIGTNGAGKSTLLRMVSGVMKPDRGTVLADRQKVYDNPAAKQNLFFIADEPYFFPNSTASDMKQYYRTVYPAFDTARFDRLLSDFGLDPARKISHYSKGMKKQLSILLGLCASTKYLLCDETFDGLDPVMRQGVKALFAGDMVERGLTPVIASHNLRELEDICDHVGLLHRGGVLLSQNVEDMKLGIQKVQCVFADETGFSRAAARLTLLNVKQTGQLHTITVRGSREEVLSAFRDVDTVFFELLPLTLEEVFISETEVVGYDIKKFILS
ncbi:MAG: ABC transporter ATP-binding protein [Clostridium sp.]|nr:ABC transporter ATP-binding protein [Clostridium sp.]MBO6150067.1 ABC transporter ATP-binding protein [Clostridium sp.]MBP3214925.1 ABC transporter ATP-binding protein [Clostridium sp.]